MFRRDFAVAARACGAREKKETVRFVSYLRARGDLEAHPNCFGITETSTFQAPSRSGRQVNYKITLPPPTPLSILIYVSRFMWDVHLGDVHI